MRPAMAVFVLFFGVALVESFRGQWTEMAFWIAMGAMFYVLERWGTAWAVRRRNRTP
jgi:hypothetical protein